MATSMPARQSKIFNIKTQRLRRTQRGGGRKTVTHFGLFLNHIKIRLFPLCTSQITLYNALIINGLQTRFTRFREKNSTQNEAVVNHPYREITEIMEESFLPNRYPHSRTKDSTQRRKDAKAQRGAKGRVHICMQS